MTNSDWGHRIWLAVLANGTVNGALISGAGASLFIRMLLQIALFRL